MNRIEFLKVLGLGSLTKFVNSDLKAPILKGHGFLAESLNKIENHSADDKAKEIINKMTFDEKVMMTGGHDGMFIPGIERLGLRPVRLTDASQGVRLTSGAFKKVKKDIKSTAFPPMLALASTWNDEMAHNYGKYIGEECRALGVDVLLGPGVNMYRVSEGGREYEYMGEDPRLTSNMVTQYIKGLQSQKVIATVKHFIANDQEFCRQIVSSDVGERALHEIYLAPFRAAIKQGDVKAVMTGNNIVNGVPCNMNRDLMADLLRKEYGFKGIAMTDWQNTSYFPQKQHLVLDSGESLLMPRNTDFAQYISETVKRYPNRKKQLERKLEAMIYPTLSTLFEMGVYDRKDDLADYEKSFKSYKKSHQALARKCAEEAICLLKNEDNILPLSTGQNLIMMGPEEPYTGTGSGHVAGYDHTDYATGLKELFGSRFKNITNPSDETIKNADVVLYRLNKEAGEGKDVPFDEPRDQNKELLRVADLNPNVVVVISAGNGMAMPWLNKVKGVVWANYLGQERGPALANVLSGKVNPSGHLPFSIEKDFKDSPDPYYNYLGGEPYWTGHNEYKSYFLGRNIHESPRIANYIKPHQLLHMRYGEGILIGYRWYETQNIRPQFPFGHGLSYSSFKYSDIKLDSEQMNEAKPVKVSFKLQNTGTFDGAEVVQLYISKINSKVFRPIKELNGFKKVFINSGQVHEITMTIHRKDLAYWDIKTHNWGVETGEYEIHIGSSSVDIRLRHRFQVS